MAGRYFFFLCLFLNVLLTSPLAAQGFLSDDTEITSVTKFDPNDLPSDWWTYFEQKDGISEALEKVVGRLHEMQKTLPPDEQTVAETLISRFLANVSVYIQLRSQNIESSVGGWLPKSHYTIAELLHLNDLITQQSVDLNIKEEEKKDLLNNINGMKGGLSNLIVQYRDKNNLSPDKFIAALKLMVQRSRIAFQEEELRILKDRMKVKQEALDQIKEEQAIAFDRLEITEKDKINLSPLKAAIETSQINFLLAETEAAKNFGDMHGNVGEQKLEQQKAFIAQTKHLINRLEYLKAEVINFLIDNHDGKIPAKSISEQLSEWNGEIVKAQNQIDYIREKTRFDHELTSRYLANTAHDDNKDEHKILDLMQLRQKEAVETMKELTAVEHLVQQITLLTNYMSGKMVQGQTIMENIEFRSMEIWHRWWSNTFLIFNYPIFSIGDVPITLSGLLGALGIIAIAIYVSKITSAAIDRLLIKEGTSPANVYTLKRIVHVVIILIGCFIALSTLGLTLSNLAIIIGALSVGIGFGLQTIVNNFLCGLMLLFERNIKVGDIVELSSGLKGTVTEIHIQNTNVSTFDGMDVIVPNSEMVTKQMTNWTRKDPYQRLHIPFGIGYEADLQKVRKLVSDAAKELPTTIHTHRKLADPDVWLVEFGNNWLALELVVWVNVFKSTGRTSIKTEYMYLIERVLRENEITIPFPQQDLHLKSIPEELLTRLIANKSLH